ncbi:MAG: Uncharacterized protein XD49_1153 [Caldanaerobacter subterraneus]|nr:MAG: Uncharacterized protein XD49_1153 [Caldanaerobacter subterraneus]
MALGPRGQVVKTPPFHGGNTGSNPVGVTIFYSAKKPLQAFYFFMSKTKISEIQKIANKSTTFMV